MLGRLYRRALNMCLAAAGAWLLLWKTVGDRNGLLYLANSWAFWILAGGWLSGWLRFQRGRAWPALICGEIMGLTLLLHYHWMLWRRRPENSEPDAPVIRVMTANLLKKNNDLAAMRRALLEYDVDVALVQEVSASGLAGLFHPSRETYPYQYWMAHPAFHLGLGVLSRVPFALEGRHSSKVGGPYCLRLRVQVAGQSLQLFNVHLISPLFGSPPLQLRNALRQRNCQTERLLEEARSLDGPVLLMGDWNATEGSDVYQQVRQNFRDCWAEYGTGPGWTWPHNLEPYFPLRMRPLLRLDHAFCTPDLEIEDAQVLPETGGSDHSPLLITLRMPAPESGNQSSV